jgi:hypothetical protein
MVPQPKYKTMGVRAWTDISDACRTRVLGFLAVTNGIERPPPSSAADVIDVAFARVDRDHKVAK